jgi:outer membrane protein
VQLILDRGRGGPTIYFEEAVDLSAQVIEEFNREFP